MIGSSGTRVIVVDDKPEEALPLLSALAQAGIAATYFHADASMPIDDVVPDHNSRLKGVRVAFLDIDLLDGASPKNRIATLLKWTKRILSEDNGPYGVIAWTFHTEDVEAFQQKLVEFDVPKPLFVVALPKSDYIVPGQRFQKLNELVEQIQKELLKHPPLHLFSAWEEGAFAAATEVTNTLSSLSSPVTSDLLDWQQQWNTKMLPLLRAIAKANHGANLTDTTCTQAIYGALNPLHADRMEHNVESICQQLQGDPTLSIWNATGEVDSESKSRINAMLQVAFSDIEQFAPGNIYLFTMKRKPSWVFPVADVLSKCLNNAIDEPAMINASFEIMVEISAACDHAQGNLKIARLVSGAIVPVDHLVNVNNAKKKTKNPLPGHFRIQGPYFLQGAKIPEGQYYLLFNSQYSQSVKLSELEKQTPYARLRTQSLTDIQLWFAQHTTRPGMLMI